MASSNVPEKAGRKSLARYFVPSSRHPHQAGSVTVSNVDPINGDGDERGRSGIGHHLDETVQNRAWGTQLRRSLSARYPLSSDEVVRTGYRERICQIGPVRIKHVDDDAGPLLQSRQGRRAITHRHRDDGRHDRHRCQGGHRQPLRASCTHRRQDCHAGGMSAESGRQLSGQFVSWARCGVRRRHALSLSSISRRTPDSFTQGSFTS